MKVMLTFAIFGALLAPAGCSAGSGQSGAGPAAVAPPPPPADWATARDRERQAIRAHRPRSAPAQVGYRGGAG